MSKLLDSILNHNLVEANELLTDRMEMIKEQKLYEVKRQLQAEAFGGLTKDEIEARKKAGYIKAADFFAAKDIVSKAKKNLEKGTKRVKAEKEAKKVVREAGPPRTITPKEREKQLGIPGLKKAAKMYAQAKKGVPTPEEPPRDVSALKKGAHELKKADVEQRRKALDARRKEKISSLEKSNPLAAERLKVRLGTGKVDTLRKVMGVPKGERITAGHVAKHIAGAITAGKS